MMPESPSSIMVSAQQQQRPLGQQPQSPMFVLSRTCTRSSPAGNEGSMIPVKSTVYPPVEEQASITIDEEESSPDWAMEVEDETVESSTQFVDSKEPATHSVEADCDMQDVASATTYAADEKEFDSLYSEDAENDANSLCSVTSELWKPFVQRVAAFVEQQNWPFEYMDVWVLANNEAKEESSHTIRHVGHATTHTTELSSIFTLYHLQQFGATSASYVFSPGVGLPGRVLARNAPVWDGRLSCTPTLSDFPRSHLARRHGVRKGLGIPLVVNQQAVVVSLYMADPSTTTASTTATSFQPTRESIGQWIQTTRQAFHQQPTTAMTVTITAPNQQGMLLESSTAAEDAVDCVCTCSYATPQQEQQPAASISYDAILPTDDQVMLARLLRDNSTATQQQQQLEALLWRAPCRRYKRDNDRLAVLQQRVSGMQALTADTVVQVWTELLSCPTCCQQHNRPAD